MTINDYEQQGGFHSELQKVRKMGETLNAIEDAIGSRPYRAPELDAIQVLKFALNVLREQIVESRNLAT